MQDQLIFSAGGGTDGCSAFLEASLSSAGVKPQMCVRSAWATFDPRPPVDFHNKLPDGDELKAAARRQRTEREEANKGAEETLERVF